MYLDLYPVPYKEIAKKIGGKIILTHLIIIDMTVVTLFVFVFSLT